MATYQILCVDDEERILKSMQRLLMNEDYQVYTAGSGKEGLEILNNHPIDLVISDQKMPQMNGAEFLGKVRERYPDTMRILLTGYSDQEATIAAINNGKIYQYISKPWDNNDLKLTIKKALDQYHLMQENKRLQEELKEHNLLLEEKVKQRTEELDDLNKQLKENFVLFIRVFLNIISKYDEELGEQGKRVAYISLLIGKKLSLSENEMEQLEIAALLHDIGLICLPKNIIKNASAVVNTSVQKLYQQHPVIGESMLSSVKTLSEVSAIIRSHHERFDGEGYPDKLVGEKIPKMARIIHVADEYDRLKQSKIQNIPFSNEKCFEYLRKYSGSILDRDIVECFASVVQEGGVVDNKKEEVIVSANKLKSGMKLIRSVNIKEGGIEILKAGTTLQDEEIKSLTSLVNNKLIDDLIYVESQ